jgi:hypothetical protein
LPRYRRPPGTRRSAKTIGSGGSPTIASPSTNDAPRRTSVVWADLSQRADQSQELPCRTHVIHGPQADSDHPDGGGRDLTISLIGCSRGNDAAGMPSELGATPPGVSASAADQFNEADVMFARLMIRRHAQAVAMSGMVLRIPACPRSHGARPADQSQPAAEIDQLNNWLDARGRKQVDEGGQHHGSHGTINAEKTRRLETPTAPAVSPRFLAAVAWRWFPPAGAPPPLTRGTSGIAGHNGLSQAST